MSAQPSSRRMRIRQFSSSCYADTGMRGQDLSLASARELAQLLCRSLRQNRAGTQGRPERDISSAAGAGRAAAGRTTAFDSFPASAIVSHVDSLRTARTVACSFRRVRCRRRSGWHPERCVGSGGSAPSVFSRSLHGDAVLLGWAGKALARRGGRRGGKKERRGRSCSVTHRKRTWAPKQVEQLKLCRRGNSRLCCP